MINSYPTSERLVIDTGVFVEYIQARASLRSSVAKLFSEAVEGRIELIANWLTLSEVFYVASRIYEFAKVEKPNEEALNYIEWLRTFIKVVDTNMGVTLKAAELKKQLKLSILDCIVIATAKEYKAKPLFKHLEKEMKPVEGELRKLGVIFLSELKHSNIR